MASRKVHAKKEYELIQKISTSINSKTHDAVRFLKLGTEIGNLVRGRLTEGSRKAERSFQANRPHEAVKRCNCRRLQQKTPAAHPHPKVFHEQKIYFVEAKRFVEGSLKQ